MAELDCIYKGERYSVRDTGEVLRHSRGGKPARPHDNQWTFGKANTSTGYMEIASVRIHRIVATAFHGAAPSKEHVVDHMDTNRQNNRPENLRWVTRLENILLNPITARRIAIVCGSVEAFLSDPPRYRDLFPEPNYKWMTNVSTYEAQLSLKRMLDWAANDKHPVGGTLGEWILNRTAKEYRQTDYQPVDAIVPAKTPKALQRNWKTPSEFPCCPQEQTVDPISEYYEKLEKGAIFSQNHYCSFVVAKAEVSMDNLTLYVISECTDNIKPWALTKISYESGFYVHTSIATFFQQTGAEKQLCLENGREWEGEESIDDFC